ncbi:MAG: type II toxin-antitoxin system VapC family toxin [Nitrospirota bacterium]
MIYLDTSALIKRFVAESGSEIVHSLVARENPVATSKIAYVEAHAALARRRRERSLSDRQFALAVSQFERDWRSYVRMDLSDDVLGLARDLVQRHPLRGYDAVHLASALRLKREIEEDVTFVAADDRLLRAARAERLDILNAEPAGSP